MSKRFSGAVGYGTSEQTAPGVWEDKISERQYFGDVIRNSRNERSAEKVNAEIVVSNSISIVADAYANDHFFDIRYVMWMGKPWIVSEVLVEAPRLVLRLGGVYNGPVAEKAGTP